ncbi:hypothetical protein GEMRC1_004578 [Eukaryota sp. GEM-RC1]
MWSSKLRAVTDKIERSLKSAKQRTLSHIYDVEATVDEEFDDVVTKFLNVKSSLSALEEKLTEMVSHYAALSSSSIAFGKEFETFAETLNNSRYVAFSNKLSTSFDKSFGIFSDQLDPESDSYILEPLDKLTAQMLVVGAAIERHQDQVFSFDKSTAQLNKLQSQGSEVADKTYLKDIKTQEKEAKMTETRAEAFRQLDKFFTSYESSVDETLKNVVGFKSSFFSTASQVLGHGGAPSTRVTNESKPVQRKFSEPKPEVTYSEPTPEPKVEVRKYSDPIPQPRQYSKPEPEVRRSPEPKPVVRKYSKPEPPAVPVTKQVDNDPPVFDVHVESNHVPSSNSSSDSVPASISLKDRIAMFNK